MSRMMHLFRKYQYMLLIVFGVLLMFVFVIGDPLSQLTGGGRAGREQAAQVVLTWKHGSVTGNELYSQRVRHNMAVEFLSEVVQETVRREGTPKGPGVYRDQFGRYNPGIAIAENEEAIVQKMLLAAKAESLGVKVDNAAVKAFLDQLSDHELDDNDLAVIYNRTISGRMTQQHLMDQLQHELLAQQMLMMSRAGLFVVPPREAWEYHNRMRRRVQTEMVVLNVDNFKDKVSVKPTESEIKQLYEEGKDRFPNPYSPEVGFKRRRKLAFEYVRADSGEMQEAEAAKIKDTITDEEIEKHYEENKPRYRVIELPEEEPATETSDAEKTPAPKTDDKSDDAEKADETPDAASPNPADEPANEEPPKSDDAPAPPAEEKSSLDAPAESTTEPAPPAATPEGEAAAAESDESELDLDEIDLEEETEAEAAEPATTPEAPAPKEPAPATEATTDDAPKPVESPKEPTSDSESTEPAPPPTTDDVASESPAAEAKPDEPKYKPLDDKLRAEIRDEIASDRSRQPAQERLTKAFDEIKAAVDTYGRQLRRLDVTKSTAKPTPVDFEKLATEHGFTAGKIDPTDVIGIEQYDLGKAYETTFTSWPPQRVSFAQMAFQDSLPVYRAQRIESAELDVDFLYWKVAEEEAYVPKLEDIRDEVVDAWKHREAFVIAKAEAEKLAKQAAGDKPLGESLNEHDGLEIIQPPPFSWMSTGSTPFGGAGAPTLSQVEGVEAAGNEFMKSVFNLEQGEAGVAVDQSQDHVYVVRIAAELPSQEMLKEQFLASGVTPEMSQIAFNEVEDVWQDWYQDLEREMNVKWKE